MPIYAFILSVCLLGCSAPTIQSYTVYEDPTAFVRLEFAPTVQREKPHTWNTHPAIISLEDMVKILSGLQVREHRSNFLEPIFNQFLDPPPVVPAFRKKEIILLGPQLVEAFDKAVPEEFVTFYVSTPVNSVTREVTSGGLYVRKNKLHVMLSNHQTVYGIPAFGLVYDRRYPTHSLAPRRFDLTFVNPEIFRIRTLKFSDQFFGTFSDDEIIIDLQKV